MKNIIGKVPRSQIEDFQISEKVRFWVLMSIMNQFMSFESIDAE